VEQQFGHTLMDKEYIELPVVLSKKHYAKYVIDKAKDYWDNMADINKTHFKEVYSC